MATKKEQQDILLTAMEDDTAIQMLYDCWTLLQRAPNKAIEILIQFKDVSNSAKLAAADIQEALVKYDALKPRLSELTRMAEFVQGFNKQVASIDESTVLNRLNRIIDVASKLSDLKKSGGLDLVETLLCNKR